MYSSFRNRPPLATNDADRSFAERRETTVAGLTREFIGRIAGEDAPETLAAARAVQDFVRREPAPPKGQRAGWAANLLAAASLAVAGCEDRTSREDTMRMPVSELQTLRNSDHGPRPEDVRARISHDKAALERFIDRLDLEPAERIARREHRSIREFRLAGITDTPHDVAKRLADALDAFAAATISERVALGGLWIPDVDQSTFEVSLLRRAAQHAASRMPSFEGVSTEADGEFVGRIRDELAHEVERIAAERRQQREERLRAIYRER